MNGDREYCYHCKKFFFETGTLCDTRTNHSFHDVCPHCISSFTINVEMLLRPGGMERSGLYLTGKNKNRHLFKVRMMKEWAEYLKYLSEHNVIFVEPKEE